ncbi:hypothetical protein MHM84_05410 [Halomonas sp. McH1-25]|uniref:hypothetical protein n=1 Tax=unclassified Halomonas TaxID=2609666 RepID=UPI001EF613F2|nr:MULTISPECIES: hypothetical protein [unclassified Halomonas]MCG7599214.1 hypothetical protein [Halomonas sp. McH1-25]MCP1341082.1 hypothetical protein [Halomonas sp. FL8]MCP1361698.1 hypothetical protein [Halomonas sp. BBD45]MCP1364580.1 hypothetical protein [Halomonas sp. BBD48]
MSESNRKDTASEEGKRLDEKDKARHMVERDRREDETSAQPIDDGDSVYRPDENVDDEKSPKARSEPGHNPHLKEASIKGSQSKDKTQQKRNIDDTAEDAESTRRDG